MRVFLTGATGYVGSVVAEKLLAAGHDVLGLSRTEAGDAKLKAAGVTPFRGDLSDPQSLAAAALLADGVIHTAFGHNFDDFAGMVETDLLALDAMLTALERKNKPIVVTNGPAFLGDSGETLHDETAPVDESSFFAVRARRFRVRPGADRGGAADGRGAIHRRRGEPRFVRPCRGRRERLSPRARKRASRLALSSF